MALADKLSWAGGKDEPLVDHYLSASERRLLRQAKTIDRVDRFLGPLESTLQLYGSPFWQGVGLALEIAELAALKAPFIIAYLRRTKDYDALYSWAPREILAGIIPYGDFIDISQAYCNRAKEFFERKVQERMVERGPQRSLSASCPPGARPRASC